MKAASSILTLTTVLLAGVASAHLTVDLSMTNEGSLYVPDHVDILGAATGGESDLRVYQEYNGCPGLQKEPVDCMGDEELEPADDVVVDPL